MEGLLRPVMRTSLHRRRHSRRATGRFRSANFFAAANEWPRVFAGDEGKGLLRTYVPLSLGVTLLQALIDLRPALGLTFRNKAIGERLTDPIMQQDGDLNKKSIKECDSAGLVVRR